MRTGTATTTSESTYSVSGNPSTITSTQPGVFFYFVKVTAPSAAFDLAVNQNRDGLGNHNLVNLFEVQNNDANQVVLWNSSCTKYARFT